MLRFERPAPGRLAAARAETGTGDCLAEGVLPRPFADGFGEFCALPGLGWGSVEGVLRVG
jgi:hypothetical protein